MEGAWGRGVLISFFFFFFDILVVWDTGNVSCICWVGGTGTLPVGVFSFPLRFISGLFSFRLSNFIGLGYFIRLIFDLLHCGTKSP